MAKKKIINGDLFLAIIKNQKRYIQYVYNDADYLGLDLIRVFNLKQGINELYSKQKVIDSRVQRYFHTTIEVGVELKCWEYLDHVPIESDFEVPVFIGTTDLGKDLRKSFNWYTIQGREKKLIGELTEEYRKYSLEGGKSPLKVIKILELGYDPMKIPE